MKVFKNFDMNEEILSVDDWFIKCPPAGKDKHKKDGRSAMELAKEIINNQGSNILSAINSDSRFKGFRPFMGAPEKRTKFDEYKGGQRAHDFVLLGTHLLFEKLVVCVEAKADETFGPKIGKYYSGALKKRSEGSNTNAPDRVEDLVKKIFGKSLDKSIDGLRYQLLHATAATVAEAQLYDAERALLLITVFRSSDSQVFDMKKDNANNRDLDLFINVLSKGKYSVLNDKEIVGPFKLNDSKLYSSKTDLYIGKVVIDID